MLARNKLLLVVLLSAALVSAVAWAAIAAKAPVNADEPITMTKGMYADLLCIAASEFDPLRGGIQFTYDPGADTLRATSLLATRTITTPGGQNPEGKFAASNAELRKGLAKGRADFKVNLLLPKLQRHVSANATTEFVGF